MDTAIILAAGLGSRLNNIFSQKPKGFLTIDNTPLINRSLDLLKRGGIRNIIIVTGHLSEFYESLESNNIICIKNEIYYKTGSFQSLLSVFKHISNDFLLLESDLLYEYLAIEKLINHKFPNVILGSNKTNSNDEVFIEADSDNIMQNISKDKKKINSIYAEFVGINKISKKTLKNLYDWSLLNIEKSFKCHYEEAFSEIKNDQFYVEKIEDLIWTEIDNESHLNRAINEVFPKIKNLES